MIIDRDVVKVIIIHSDGSKDEYVGKGYTDLNRTETKVDKWLNGRTKPKVDLEPFSQFLVALRITDDMAASIASRAAQKTVKSVE